MLGAKGNGGHWLDVGSSSNRPGMRIYTNGNIINDVLKVGDDNWNMYRHRFDIVKGQFAGTKQWDRANEHFKSNSPFPLLGVNKVKIKTASAALAEVGNDAGCSKRLNSDGSISSNYDELDTIFLNYLKTNTYVKHRDPDNVVNEKYYIEYQNSISITPFKTRAKDYDSDLDGMPNDWEILNGFDPYKKDHNNDLDGNGYTNLEEFLNLIDL